MESCKSRNQVGQSIASDSELERPLVRLAAVVNGVSPLTLGGAILFK